MTGRLRCADAVSQFSLTDDFKYLGGEKCQSQIDPCAFPVGYYGLSVAILHQAPY
jgi:hypothetical protein